MTTGTESRPRPPTESFHHADPKREGRFEWVYLWSWPIRAMHWIAAGSIVVLTVTGLYIGKPYFITGGDTANHYLMGWMRFLHFAAAAALVATGIVRIYWLFAGNRFERIGALFPVRPREWRNMFRMVKFYLMIRPDEAPRYLGHNPLQQLSYTVVYGLVVVMVVTGFALYGQSNPDGIFFTLFAWVPALLGGLQVTRFVHHVLTWAFLIFIPIHVYLSIRSDVYEHTGLISTIISGGRWVPADRKYVDE